MARLRIPEDKQAEILRLYGEGMSARRIVFEVGVSDGTVRRVIARHHGSVERRYCSGPEHPLSNPPWDPSEFIKDYNAGMKREEMALKYEVSVSHVSRMALNLGCKSRLPRKWDEGLREAVVRGLQPGQTWRQLARDHFVSIETVARMRKRIRLEGVGSE